MSSRAKPKFNHVAMTVSPDLLDADGRQQILDFYGDVFGWAEMPTMTEDRRRLVLMAYEFGQFVFLEASDAPMRTNPDDHFGMAVESMEQLDEMLAKAKAWQAKDSRVRIVDKHLDDFQVLHLTSFYVQHLLPLMIEVQHFAWQTPGGSVPSAPE